MADAPKVPTVKKADENARQLTVVHKATKKTHVVSRKHYENNKDKYELAQTYLFIRRLPVGRLT